MSDKIDVWRTANFQNPGLRNFEILDLFDHVSLKIFLISRFNFISNKKRCSGCPHLNNFDIPMVLRFMHAHIMPSIIKIRDERSVEDDGPGRNLIFN